jgi:hypothetical protein
MGHARRGVAKPNIGVLAALGEITRSWERLEAGEAAVSLQDGVADVRLAWQIERDEAIPARDKSLAELAEVRLAMLTRKAAVIRRSGPDEWRGLAGEVQEERERAREIRKAQRLATMGRPRR